MCISFTLMVRARHCQDGGKFRKIWSWMHSIKIIWIVYLHSSSFSFFLKRLVPTHTHNTHTHTHTHHCLVGIAFDHHRLGGQTDSEEMRKNPGLCPWWAPVWQMDVTYSGAFAKPMVWMQINNMESEYANGNRTSNHRVKCHIKGIWG